MNNDIVNEMNKFYTNILLYGIKRNKNYYYFKIFIHTYTELTWNI